MAVNSQIYIGLSWPLTLRHFWAVASQYRSTKCTNNRHPASELTRHPALKNLVGHFLPPKTHRKIEVPRVPHDFPQELKRPASRKKDEQPPTEQTEQQKNQQNVKPLGSFGMTGGMAGCVFVFFWGGDGWIQRRVSPQFWVYGKEKPSSFVEAKKCMVSLNHQHL